MAACSLMRIEASLKEESVRRKTGKTGGASQS
jgi:hypothetical protein